MAKKPLDFTTPGGRIRQIVQSVTLVNNTLLAMDTLVPPNKEWILQSIKVTNSDNVDRSIEVFVYLEAAGTNLIIPLMAATVVATQTLVIPNLVATNAYANTLLPGYPIVGGNIIRVVFNAGGVSAGAVDADGLVIVVREIDK